jgi:hypothetical protein
MLWVESSRGWGCRPHESVEPGFSEKLHSGAQLLLWRWATGAVWEDDGQQYIIFAWAEIKGTEVEVKLGTDCTNISCTQTFKYKHPFVYGCVERPGEQPVPTHENPDLNAWAKQVKEQEKEQHAVDIKMVAKNIRRYMPSADEVMLLNFAMNAVRDAGFEFGGTPMWTNTRHAVAALAYGGHANIVSRGSSLEVQVEAEIRNNTICVFFGDSEDAQDRATMQKVVAHLNHKFQHGYIYHRTVQLEEYPIRPNAGDEVTLEKEERLREEQEYREEVKEKQRRQAETERQRQEKEDWYHDQQVRETVRFKNEYGYWSSELPRPGNFFQ